MGRPLKQLFMGNRYLGGASGQGVASVTLGGVNNSTGYNTGDPVTFSAPQVAGGVAATGTIVAAAGVIQSITITSEGSGYTAAPTVTPGGTGTIGTLTLTAVLTTNRATVACLAYVVGGASAVAGDIVKQKGNKIFKVATAQGVSECALVASATPTAGQMNIAATDFGGGTYWVTKLNDRTVVVTQSGAGPWEFTSGTKVKWANTAVTGQSVKITY